MQKNSAKKLVKKKYKLNIGMHIELSYYLLSNEYLFKLYMIFFTLSTTKYMDISKLST